MKLYEVNKEIEKIFDEVEAQQGEITDEQDKLLTTLEVLEDDKIQSIVGLIKNLGFDVIALKEEADRLTYKKKTIEKKIEWLKRYLTTFLRGEKWKNAFHNVYFMNTEKVEVDEKDLSEDFFRVKTIIEKSPDKDAIKVAIKSGVEVKGATLINNKSIVIK